MSFTNVEVDLKVLKSLIEILKQKKSIEGKMET